MLNKSAFRISALALILSAALPVHAAKKKNSSETITVTKTVVETVFVREDGTANLEKARLRNYSQAYGVSAAIYSADLLGSNPYGYFSYDWFPIPTLPFFAQVTAGIGWAQSSFSRDVVGARLFHPNTLIGIEALGGWNLGAPRGKNAPAGVAGGLFPYLQGGVVLLIQGKQPNIGAVIGFGQRLAWPWSSSKRWAVTYGVKDHLYTQKIGSPSFTQNPVVHAGLLRYY